MSYSPGAYVPPPPAPAKRGRSPWFFVGMGCLGLVLITLGLVGYGAYQMVTAINRPVTNDEVVRSLGGVPIYPNAKLDMATTKVIQGTAAMTRMITGKQTFAAGVFRTSVTPDQAVVWYDVELKKLGYEPTNARQPSIGQKMENQVMHQYFKKKAKEIVIVQAGVVPEDKKTDPADATMLIVMRMIGANPTSGASGKEFVPDAPLKK
ncbi:MAG: hypothetical protein V4671_08645 [Armatimonadota bacterium]